MSSLKANRQNNTSDSLLTRVLLLSPIQKFTVHGNSMSPLFKEGQEVLINRLAYFFANPNVDDIVIIKNPKNNMYIIKRVSAISENSYFVTGDNAKASTDSRHFGTVRKSAILGRVISIV